MRRQSLCTAAVSVRRNFVQMGHFMVPERLTHCFFEMYSIKNYAIDGIGNRSARSSVPLKGVQDWTTQFKRK